MKVIRGCRLVLDGLGLGCTFLMREDLYLCPQALSMACALPSVILKDFQGSSTRFMWRHWCERLSLCAQLIGNIVHHRCQDSRRALPVLTCSVRCLLDAYGKLCQSGWPKMCFSYGISLSLSDERMLVLQESFWQQKNHGLKWSRVE